MKRIVIFLIISLFVFSEAVAQYYDTGQDPASLRWLQIGTPHFRVIYPTDFGDEAARYATLLEESFRQLSSLYPGVKTRIPVIIHNHSMQSNGYVTWAPRRMELYPLPGQDNLPMDPARQLTVHETTHVLQLGSLNRAGAARILKYLLGEQAAAVGALQIPQWAFEGDAVFAETAATLSGRGRSNSFIRGARALTISRGGMYGYDKLLAGSYRNFTPDHYVFGYLMMNHLRTTSPGAWQEAIRKVSDGWHINPVRSALRREAGLTQKQLFDATFTALAREWAAETSTGATGYEPLSVARKRDYVSHFTPHRLDDGRIVSLRTSLSDPSRFVITAQDGSSETTLMTTGYTYPYIFSSNGRSLVWSETVPDIRWENRDYSVIKRLDPESGMPVTLTHRTRYAAPDLSPDGRTVVAVSTTTEMRSSLVFIDSHSGELLMDVLPPDGVMLQRPAWSSDGQEVTVVTLNGQGEGIRGYRPTGKRWISYLDEGVTDIVQARLHNDTLFFLAQGDGSDNIYRMGGDRQIERVTASRYGISGFSVRGSELLFSDYTAGGFVIARTATSATAGPADITRHEITPPPAPMPPAGDAANAPLPVTGQYNLTPRPYRKAAHLINPHSWFPFWADISQLHTDPTSVRPGVTLMSQNHLSTLTGLAGYEYRAGNHYLHTGFTWKGWHPVVDAQMVWGGEQQVIRESNGPWPDRRGRDLQMNMIIYDQLWFARSRFRQMVMPALYLSYRNRQTWVRSESRFDEGIIFLTGRLYLSNTFRMAWRDINPRWGQVADLRLTTMPWDTKLYGSRRYARTTLFFPGLFPNHSLVLRAGGESQSPVRQQLYGNALSLPRGYKEELTIEKLFSMSADYTMPLLYPDLAADGLLYLKRIRGTLFYDHAVGRDIRDHRSQTLIPGPVRYNSAGTELLADFWLLRIPFEISAGVRAGYMPADQKIFINGVFSVNIYGTVLGRERW